MKQKAIQDLYPDDFAVCYGCGKNNPDGYQLKTYLIGQETIAHFTPDEKHTAIPGSVYGGLVASLLDCHGTGSAAAFICKEDGISLEEGNIPVRCVTAQLNVKFVAPTPMGVELELKGTLIRREDRKVWVEITLGTKDTVTATAEMLAIRLKEE